MLANIPRFFHFIALIRLKTEVANPEAIGLFTQFKKSDFRVQKKQIREKTVKYSSVKANMVTWSKIN